MVVVKVVDQHVADKVDTDFISDQFAHVNNISVVFICTKGESEDDDFEEDGMRYLVISLPYEDVSQLKTAKAMMLEKVTNKLGFPYNMPGCS
jgi:hypothetical protein